MQKVQLNKVDFSYYQRLLAQLAGAQSVAFLNGGGKPVWLSEGAAGEEIAAAIADAASAGCFAVDADSAKSLGQREFAGKVFHCIGLFGINDYPVGWLAMLTGAEEAAMAGEALAETAAAVVREYGYISDIDRLAEEVSDRYEELHLVYGMRNMIKEHGYLFNIYAPLLDLCIESLRVDLAVFLYPDRGIFLHAKNPDSTIHSLDLVLSRLRSEVYRFLASGKETVVINRDNDPLRTIIWTNMPLKFLAAPVMYDKKIKAAIILLRTPDQLDFSNSDRNLVEAIIDQVAGILKNQLMFGELQMFTKEMAATLIEAVDAKDPYTRGHSDRVNRYAVALGQALKLPEGNQRHLFWASLLHDIGKIGVPDVILGKPGRLTEDEYILIKGHPQRSHDILVNVGRLKPVLPAILHHHEKFDGTGYPDELEGAAIPLHARIIAVADTFDAITSSRAYRPAMSNEEALAEIRRVSGTQLDPELVDVFINLVLNDVAGFFGHRNEE